MKTATKYWRVFSKKKNNNKSADNPNPHVGFTTRLKFIQPDTNYKGAAIECRSPMGVESGDGASTNQLGTSPRNLDIPMSSLDTLKILHFPTFSKLSDANPRRN